MINMRMSIQELDDLIVAMINHLDNKKFIGNIRKFVKICRKESYADVDRSIRVYVINKICISAIDDEISDKTILLNSLSFATENEQIANNAINVLNSVYNREMTEKQAARIDEKISTLIKYSIISDEAKSIIDKLNDISGDTSVDIAKDLADVQELMGQTQTKLVKYDESINNENNAISLGDSSFIARMSKVIEKEKNPSSTVKTGIQKFNEILGGGFKAGRVYCVMAPMKNWKSGLLFTSCFWAKKYNNLKAKDPNKQPVILYITLENSIDESIVRMMGYCEGNNYMMAEHTTVENMKILSAHGLYDPTDKSSAVIDMVYRPNKSITVKDIGLLMDEYEKMGKEVVYLAVDYIKRIRPEIVTKDLRLDLGGIADDLHVLAIERDIPIFTAMQLNRGAISEMDNADTFEAKLSAFNRIGASNAGESIDIPQNVDMCLTMVRNVDVKLDEFGNVEHRDTFISIRVVASRYRTSDIDSFIHPFEPGNDMKLVEDVNSSTSKSIIRTSELIAQKAANVKTKGARHVV